MASLLDGMTQKQKIRFIEIDLESRNLKPYKKEDLKQNEKKNKNKLEKVA